MKQNDKQTLTPKLRFPEFRDEPGWEEKPLDAVCSQVERKTRKPDDHYTRLGVRSHNKGTFHKKNEDPSKNSMEYLYEVHENDLILNITFAWEGAIAIANPADTGTLVSHRFPTYVFDREVVLPKFYQYRIHNKRFIYNLGVISPGGAGRNRVLNKKDFLKLKPAIPKLREQQKIADCLGSLDRLITSEGRKLTTLRNHKRGLMQQLFPQPGETQPRLRFPEFWNKEDWEEKPFETLYDFKPNNTYSREKLNYENGTVKNIHYGDIHTRFSTHFHINAEEVPFVNADALPNELNPESLCRPGDVIFADASEDLADVGKCIEIVDVRNERVLSGSHTILARPRSQPIVVGFGGYLFKSRSARAGIEKEAQGIKVMQISPKRLAKIQVFIPSDDEEQQAIADCLSSLDNQIAAQAEKIDTLKQHKRGLMQQLFPATDELEV